MRQRAERAALVCFELGLVQLRTQPLRTLVSLLALAAGVALFTAVTLVNAVALNQFSQATRQLAGDADLIIRGADGFDEQLYARLALLPEVRIASPLLEIEVVIPGSRATLKVLGLDLFRAGALQPALIGSVAADFLGLFEPDAIYLSSTAAQALQVGRGERFEARSGAQQPRLRVRGLLPQDAYPQRLGIMDIASAQWRFERVGRLNRIDLRLIGGTDVDAFRNRLATQLPPGVRASTPQIETQRIASLTRAYRVNLSMLALVSLLTGALLLFATQTFSVLRRRTSLGLLRALGATRGAVQAALLAEGITLGAVGAALGIAMGYLIATLFLKASLRPEPWALAGIFVAGTACAALGAWLPAREAAARAPARALKAGDAELAVASLRPSRLGLSLLVLAGVFVLLPAVGGIPVFGYIAIAALLLGGLLLVPACTVWLLRRAPQAGRPTVSIGLAQVQGSVAQLQVNLAAVIVAFALMVAMAIMVYSFRESFEHWLQGSLPADLQLRIAPDSGARALDAQDQQRLKSIAGIARVELRRNVSLILDDARPPAVLSARESTPGNNPGSLALVASAAIPADAPNVAWVSEVMQDTYGMRAGERVSLPLAGDAAPVFVAGVFRDYAHPGGAVVIDRQRYTALTGDRSASEAALWLQPRTDANRVSAAIRSQLAAGAGLEIRTTDEVRTLSLRAFDRAFEVTHALEAVAVLIGLVGIACAGASTALARRAEFGMLRHLGMLRRQIVLMLAVEGFAISALAALYGLVLGSAISLVLIHVVNRQSFNWSIDVAFPGAQLAGFAAALLFAATLTNVVSARAALKSSALRAVREDW